MSKVKFLAVFLLLAFWMAPPAVAYSVPLTFDTLGGKIYKGLDFNVSLLASPGGTLTAGTTIVLNTPDSVNIKTVTPGQFYSYPLNTEMLALGISCSQDADCRTTASGVGCDLATSRCINSTYPANTLTQLRFDLGAACDVNGSNCYVPQSSGQLALLTFTPAKVGQFFLNFDPQTTAAVIDQTGQPVATNSAVLGNNLPLFVIPQCSMIDADGNGRIDIKDIQYVSGKWNTATGAANFNLKADIDENGVINIKDIQYVSSRWSEICI